MALKLTGIKLLTLRESSAHTALRQRFLRVENRGIQTSVYLCPSSYCSIVLATVPKIATREDFNSSKACFKVGRGALPSPVTNTIPST